MESETRVETAPSPRPQISPAQEALELAGSHIVARAVQAAVRLKLPQMLMDGPRSSVALSGLIGAHEPSLYRLLRNLAGFGCFAEGPGKVFSLTPVGRALLSQMVHEPAGQTHVLCSTAMWALSERIFDLVMSGPQPQQHGLYDRAADGTGTARSVDTMLAFHAEEHRAVAAALELPAHGLIIDVGGSTGNLLESILTANPGLSGIVFDLPATVAGADRRLAALGLEGRCDMVGGSFFDAVPAGGDVYLLSNILQDWPDDDATTILRNCRRAMGPSGRLLIAEHMIEMGPDDRIANFLDLILLATTKGRERSVGEHESLLGDAGFRLNRVITTAVSVSIAEAQPA